MTKRKKLIRTDTKYAKIDSACLFVSCKLDILHIQISVENSKFNILPITEKFKLIFHS